MARRRRGERTGLARALLFAMCLVAGYESAVAATNRPLYFDRLVTDADLEGRSADELRLMRNTIFARVGRVFEDPALRDYFSRQPWYRPAATPRELSAIDRKNVAGIKLWERRAKALEGLHKVVPGFDETRPTRAQPECGASEHGVLRDKGLERQLVREAGRLSWAAVPNYGDIGFDSLPTKMKAVRIECGPDIDGDGSPEAVVTLTHQAPSNEGVEYPSIDLMFLATRSGTKWRAIAPLGISGSILGVEGSFSTSIRFVTLADGRRALTLERAVGGGGDCDCDSEEIAVAILQHGKLQTRGTFETGKPCECQYAETE